jgi:hypothetical protein
VLQHRSGTSEKTTAALLNIELFGSRIVGGKLRGLNKFLSLYPKEKTPSGSIISATVVAFRVEIS